MSTVHTISPLKILYVITESEMGGAQVHVSDLMAGCKTNCNVALACGDRGFLTDRAESLGVPVYIVPDMARKPGLVKDLRALSQLLKVIDEFKPDVLHAHTFKAGVVGRIAAQIRNVPSVYTAHTWCFQPGTGAIWKKVGWFAERLCAPMCFKIITVSDSQRELAISYKVAKPDQLFRIHNGVPDNPLRAVLPSSKPYKLVMVGRFVPQKDQMGLVESLAEIDEEWELTFVGDGPTMSAVMNRAQELSVANRIKFLGARRDVAKILADSHIFVFASHLEGLPLAILEGMRAGLPVVATDVGGVRELVEERETGTVVPHGDKAALGAAVRELLNDSALARRMGEQARMRYERSFSFDRMIDRTIDLYPGSVYIKERTRAQTV